jgi:hypothetical protein
MGGSWGGQLTPLLLAAFCMSVSENAYRVVLPYHLLQLAGGVDALQSAPLAVAQHERLKVRTPLSLPDPPPPWHLRSVRVVALSSGCISRSASVGFGVERRVPASVTAGSHRAQSVRANNGHPLTLDLHPREIRPA